MSCGQIALKNLNIPVTKYFACEIDKFAAKVSSANFPQTIHLGDVTKVDFKSIGCIDLLIGGSPCQGFSIAGKQLNFDDPRSKLFFEFVRAKEELNPKHFLLENVVMKKEYQKIISEYVGCEPIEINSSLVTGQNRKRLYWTNIPFDQIQDNETCPVKQIGLPEGYFFATVGTSKNRVIRRTRKAGCLTATMYKGARAAGRPLISSIEGVHFDDAKGMIRMPTPEECEVLQTVPIGYTSHVSNTQRYKMLGNGWTVKVIEHIFKYFKDEKSGLFP